MSEFEILLQENLIPLQRYVKFKISDSHDAEDVIQEVCLSATEKFGSLKDPTAFKAWLISIASAAPIHTSMCVRKPAGRRFLPRSRPMTPPQNAATVKRTTATRSELS